MEQKNIYTCLDQISMSSDRKEDLKKRIYEKTARETAPVRYAHRWTHRITAAVLTAAILCSVGAMAVYYGLADKFSLFSFAEAPLDSDIEPIIAQYGAAIDQSVVINGVTATAEAYLADKTNLHILYSLEFDSEDQLETFIRLRDSVAVYLTDINGRDRGHILGGSSGFFVDHTPGKHYFTKTYTLADSDMLAEGSTITMRFTSDKTEASDFDFNAYIAKYPIQACNWKDAVFHPVSFTRNDITYTVQAIVTSGNDLSICYTIDRKEHAALSEAELTVLQNDEPVCEKLLGGMTAFNRDGQIVYVKGYAISPQELTGEVELHISDQYDLSFPFTPNTKTTAYYAGSDFNSDALSQALSSGFVNAVSTDEQAAEQFYIDSIHVTPLSVTFAGTVSAEANPNVCVKSLSYGDTDDYLGMHLLRDDGTAVRIAHASIEVNSDHSFVCTLVIAEPIDPDAAITIESAETGQQFTFG